MNLPSPVAPPERTLLGPGPSNVPESVLRALAAPTIGHLDPAFLRILDEVRSMLRPAFGTENRLTLPISGTGSAGMETCLVNLVEPGERVLVGVNGVFGTRLAEVARRAGAEVTTADGEWGRAIGPERLERAAAGRSYKLVCIVHGETSTGVLEDLAPMRAVADAIGALLVVDTVTTLCGVPIELDSRGVDAAYSGTQKCLSCPPGLSPVSFSARAVAALHSRKRPVQSWYLDVQMIGNYWDEARVYHHTAPINMIYGLHEALRLALGEGLPARFERHRSNARALGAGLEAMGLVLRVPESERLAPLTTVAVPDGVDDTKVRTLLLEEHGIEIGGGLGPMKGNTWRFGLMGEGSTEANVLRCLGALESVLARVGFRAREDGVRAARAAWRSGA